MKSEYEKGFKEALTHERKRTKVLLEALMCIANPSICPVCKIDSYSFVQPEDVAHQALREYEENV